jgi:hypothetical protein
LHSRYRKSPTLQLEAFFCSSNLNKKIMVGSMNRKLKAQIVLKFGTQADFAQALGEYRSVVSDVVRGRRALPDHKQLEWAMVLSCRPIDIFPKQSGCLGSGECGR